MSSSLSLEERFEAMMKNFEIIKASNDAVLSRLEEKERQNEYLEKQLGSDLRQKQRVSEEPSHSGSKRVERKFNRVYKSSSEEEEERIPRGKPRIQLDSNDFRVEIPEYDGRLDPEEFIEWLQVVERVFAYKEVPEEKKVKLVALRLRKYASLWWTNLCSKRVRERKSKIRTWEKMKSKLTARFLPSTYVQDSYSQLHHLTQGNMNVEEYTREFEKLTIKCDLHEPEEQTIVRYLGGLNPSYSNVVDLQAYTSFDEVCVLSHKVEQQKQKQHMKPLNPKPSFPLNEPLNKGSSPPSLAAPTAPTPPTPQKSQAPQIKPRLFPKGPLKCFKCQGFGHVASDCPNTRVISLAEWKETKREYVLEEEENEGESKETALVVQEEFLLPADEGDLLDLPTQGSKSLSLFLTSIESPQTDPFGDYQESSPNNTLTISLSPHLLSLILRPLKRKFCHKDKWKEPPLVL